MGETESGDVISFLGEVFAWFADPTNWTGNRGVLPLLWAHVRLSALAVALAMALAIPPAVLLAHHRRGGLVAVSAVNLARAVPSFGLIAVLFPITLATVALRNPLGFWATVVAMVLLAMPPMFVNAYTAVREVDPALTEAARGMGMTGSEVLRRVELPLGVPLIMAGIRTAAVAVVATATLSAWVGYGTLGTYIFVGFAQRNTVLSFVGGLLVALLSVVTELALGWVQRRTDPVHRAVKVGRERRSSEVTVG